MLKIFAEKETNASIAVNSDRVRLVREFQGITKIIFDDSSYVLVSESYLETISRLNEKK
jgi:DNA-binding LytR/AlgR family response regulator